MLRRTPASVARVLRCLLDENLSPRVAVQLRVDGHDAVHVRDRSLLGEPDPVVLERAFEEDRIFVSANVLDFRKLAVARELHSGLILIEDGGLRRDEQLELMQRLVPVLLGLGDLVNRVLTVRLDGELIVEELPKPT